MFSEFIISRFIFCTYVLDLEDGMLSLILLSYFLLYRSDFIYTFTLIIDPGVGV